MLCQLQATREHDARFDVPPDEVPYGAIALALLLTLFGMAAFILAWLHYTQQLFGKEQAVSMATACTAIEQLCSQRIERDTQVVS